MRIVKDFEGNVVATILNPKDYVQFASKKFFSADTDSIQIGSLFFPMGSAVIPHVHLKRECGQDPMEILLVLYGATTVTVYDSNKRILEEIDISAQDILIQKRGGHGFSFSYGDVLMLEIKSGPYTGRGNDKEDITT
jgi:hypothetical protein